MPVVPESALEMSIACCLNWLTSLNCTPTVLREKSYMIHANTFYLKYYVWKRYWWISRFLPFKNNSLGLGFSLAKINLLHKIAIMPDYVFYILTPSITTDIQCSNIGIQWYTKLTCEQNIDVFSKIVLVLNNATSNLSNIYKKHYKVEANITLTIKTQTKLHKEN